MCDLSSKMKPQAWGEEVAKMYKIPPMSDYVQTLEGPNRRFFEDDKAVKGEIITSLTEVILIRKMRPEAT